MQTLPQALYTYRERGHSKIRLQGWHPPSNGPVAPKLSFKYQETNEIDPPPPTITHTHSTLLSIYDHGIRNLRKHIIETTNSSVLDIRFLPRRTTRRRTFHHLTRLLLRLVLSRTYSLAGPATAAAVCRRLALSCPSAPPSTRSGPTSTSRSANDSRIPDDDVHAEPHARYAAADCDDYAWS